MDSDLSKYSCKAAGCTLLGLCSTDSQNPENHKGHKHRTSYKKGFVTCIKRFKVDFVSRAMQKEQQMALELMAHGLLVSTAMMGVAWLRTA